MIFEEIYTTYYPKVFRLCMGYLNDAESAKDIAQETFIKIWQQQSTFRNESLIGTWIFKIASNNCLRQIEKTKRQSQTILDAHQSLQQKTTASNLEGPKEFLYQCISQLPELDRIIISLELEELDQKEIAAIVGISKGNVRVKVHRIKQILKQKFKTYER